MRDIKFRAWSNKWDRMIYPEDSFYDINVHTNTAWKDSCDDECIELMQFTGFKDKNGKEIYEGDIFEKNGLIQHVHWNRLNASFYLQPRHLTKNFDDKIGRYGFDEIELFKIIGNIYENPELIK